MEVSARFVDLRREVRLYCEKGLALLPDAYADHIQIIHQPSVAGFEASAADPKDSQRQLRPISTEPPLLRELKAMVDYLQEGSPPRSSAQDAATSVEILCKLRELAGFENT